MGELDAQYPLHCLPRQYRDPEQLYLQLKRDQQTQPDQPAVADNR